MITNEEKKKGSNPEPAETAREHEVNPQEAKEGDFRNAANSADVNKSNNTAVSEKEPAEKKQ